ncbi:pentapeptide repeat-containing protein [Amycolatopsis sp. NPDC058278]|uniref:pentapeptide repeat-containing protein n=1 Tax=Amycolatopsis sp. NPDC058278 TaxID=3346417 RepID=UPI0036DD2E85
MAHGIRRRRFRQGRGVPGARFGELWFNRAKFGGAARFSGATFAGNAEFGGVRVRLAPPRGRTSVRLAGEVIDEDAYPEGGSRLSRRAGRRRPVCR